MLNLVFSSRLQKVVFPEPETPKTSTFTSTTP